jgi:hypothetical protein
MTALRWLFFIPLAFVASIAVGACGYWFGNISVRYFDLGEIGEVISWTMSGIGSGIALILVGLKIAPVRNNKVKWVLVAIVMTFGTISAMGEFFGGDSKVGALAGVAMILIGIGVARTPVEELLELLGTIFRRSKTPTTTKGASADVEKIVRAYNAVNLSRKSVIADVSELPYPKATIKSALLAALSVTTDMKMREQLKAGFVMLANFQENVGPGPYPFDSKRRDGEDDAAMMKRIAATPAPFPEVAAKTLAEERALLAELKTLG